jgi:hypothetical protein
MRLVVVKVTVSSLPLIYVVWVTGHRLVIVSKTSVWALHDVRLFVVSTLQEDNVRGC